MRIFASVLVVLGLLMTLGGIAGVMNGNPTGMIRLAVGIVIVVVAFAIKPKAKEKATPPPRR